MWCRRFSFAGGALPLAVEEEWGAGLGGTVWAGAVCLARHLRRERLFFARPATLAHAARRMRSDGGGAAAAAAELRTHVAAGTPLVAIELGAGCNGLPGARDHARRLVAERAERWRPHPQAWLLHTLAASRAW